MDGMDDERWTMDDRWNGKRKSESEKRRPGVKGGFTGNPRKARRESLQISFFMVAFWQVGGDKYRHWG